MVIIQHFSVVIFLLSCSLNNNHVIFLHLNHMMWKWQLPWIEMFSFYLFQFCAFVMLFMVSGQYHTGKFGSNEYCLWYIIVKNKCKTDKYISWSAQALDSPYALNTAWHLTLLCLYKGIRLHRWGTCYGIRPQY